MNEPQEAPGESLRSLDVWIERLQLRVPQAKGGLWSHLGAKAATGKAVERLRHINAGSSKLSPSDTMRMLIASGVLLWSEQVGANVLPANAENISFASFALWPLVTVKTLSGEWFDDLQELASPPVAKAVRAARLVLQAHGEVVALRLFTAEIGKRHYASGLVNVLADLNDPDRGGYAFSSLLLLSQGKKAPRGLGTREFFLWIGSAAVTGAIGNAFYDGLKDEWQKLKWPSATAGGSSSSDSSGGSSDSNESGTNHGGSKFDGGVQAHNPNQGRAIEALATQAHQGQGLNVDVASDWFSNLLNGD